MRKKRLAGRKPAGRPPILAAMSRTTLHTVAIEFGDCDPAEPGRLRAVAVPDDIRALCEEGAAA